MLAKGNLTRSFARRCSELGFKWAIISSNTAIEMAGFKSVSLACFPVIETASYRSAPSSDPRSKWARLFRRD